MRMKVDGVIGRPRQQAPAVAPRPPRTHRPAFSVSGTPGASVVQALSDRACGRAPRLQARIQTGYEDVVELARAKPAQREHESASGGDDLASIHETARRGTSGSGGPLPHLERIQRSFGKHDVSSVVAHTDDSAAVSARAIGAKAYTVGHHVAFAGEPSLHTAAHEAAHVIQQRAGVQLQGGVGREGDRYEQHADTVADQVARGRSVEALLDQHVHDSSGTAGAQRKCNTCEVQKRTCSACAEDRSKAKAAGSDGERERLAPAAVHVVGVSVQRELDGGEQLEEPLDVEESTEEDEDEASDGDTEVLGLNAESSPEREDEAGTEIQAKMDGFMGMLQRQGGKQPSPAKSPPKAAAKKKKPTTITKIEIDQATQRMTVVYDDGTTESHAVSTGRGLPNTKDDPCKTQTEYNCTPNGTFVATSRGDANTKNGEGDAMSWYVGFVDGRGIGIHDSQPVPGVPHSHGCVRVGNTAADDAFAKKLNQKVVLGKTLIIVSGKAPTKPWKKAVPKKKAKAAPKKKKKSK